MSRLLVDAKFNAEGDRFMMPWQDGWACYYTRDVFHTGHLRGFRVSGTKPWALAKAEAFLDHRAVHLDDGDDVDQPPTDEALSKRLRAYFTGQP